MTDDPVRLHQLAGNVDSPAAPSHKVEQFIALATFSKRNPQYRMSMGESIGVFRNSILTGKYT